MAGYNQPGGSTWPMPDFSDSTPPTPANQGSMGPEGMGSNEVDEHTFESGMAPTATASDESNWQPLVNSFNGHEVRGYRPEPVGGSYNPGQAGSGRSMKSAYTEGPTEKSNAAA